MAQLEFKYTSDQAHQVEAIEATVGLFKGQQFVSSKFTGATAKGDGLFADDTVLSIGHGNDLHVSARQLEENLHAVQEDNCIAPSSVITDGRLRDFTIEMETGTGKTYVYIRTIYEMNKRYGITKFCIVVPSVAIREGIMKSFQTTRKHFETLYDRTPLDVFIYDSKDMGPVGNFATSSSIQVMIINIGAFNKAFEDDGEEDRSNLFHRRSEKLIGGRSPREVVAACKPIVIIDEPQSVDNTAKAKKAIASLNPLFVLRYSATHKQKYNMLYRLTPVDAFQRDLVKGICVDSIMSQEDLNGAYVRLESTKASPFSASLTIDVKQGDGSQKRKKVTVKTGDHLYDKSKENVDYEAGWIVSNIETTEGEEFVEFQNGEILYKGQAIGDVADSAIKRAQIRSTIEDHLQRQLELYPRGIKVLSLFFIDKVDKYRVYEPEVHNGEYANIFEQEYADVVAMPKWQKKHERAGVPLPTDASALHQGYFAKDGKGKFKNTTSAASSAADTSAFELIMHKKETLISFPDGSCSAEENADRQVQFIFSHSALKEGWDNPNVFQICTLVETKDTLTKRQKIGRGLRLCVNQDGERCYDPEANVLTVIANESYKDFADGLQREFEKDDFKFGILTPESFTRIVVAQPSGQEEKLGYKKSKEVFEHLKAEKLIDEKGKITPELKTAAETGKVELPEELAPAVEQVCAVILHKAQKLQIKDKKQEVEVELDKDVSLSPEFQALWNRIRQRTRFEVDVDSDAIIADAIEGIEDMPKVKPLEVSSIRADLSVDESGVAGKATGTSLVKTAGARIYDLPDPIAEIQDVVGLTRATIKKILVGCGRFEEFAIDPATFLAQVTGKIQKAKNAAIAKGIKYVKLPDDEWFTMKDLETSEAKGYLGQNAWKPEHDGKSLYNYVIYDSATVEQPFAKELDLAEEVKVFAKLPDSFKIDTPLGSYNPDWAYVVEQDGENRVYFVTETKGGGNADPTLRLAEKAKIDCAKRHFAALDLGDDFEYDVKTTYAVVRA